MNLGDKKLSIINSGKGINIQLIRENGETDFELELLPDQAVDFVIELMQAIYKTGYKRAE